MAIESPCRASDALHASSWMATCIYMSNRSAEVTGYMCRTDNRWRALRVWSDFREAPPGLYEKWWAPGNLCNRTRRFEDGFDANRGVSRHLEGWRYWRRACLGACQRGHKCN